MNAQTELVTLRDTIDLHRTVLQRIESAYSEFVATLPAELSERQYHQGIVIADYLEKYYTCLETLFLRVAQHFENNLRAERWHHDLLDRMRIRIGPIRERVISDDAYPLLVELLKFRHFKRYYFDIRYDWDKLTFLMKKFSELRAILPADLDRFVAFLDRLIAKVNDTD